jgi:uncharacterized protein YecE (DUF72 family)
MSKKWYVGTSGFMVPKGVWLDLPGLNCIEINSTFYSLPSSKTVDNWKKLSDDHNLFFSIKCSKFITHIKRLKDCKIAWNKFYNRIRPLNDRLKAILIQLPPSFRLNDENFERVKQMGKYLPRDPTIVFEFRDKSWFVPKVYRLMKKYKFCLGGTAIERPTKVHWLGNLPTGIHIPPKTSKSTYIRIHGEKGYKGYYSSKKLRKIKNLIKERKTKKNFVMFNNTFFSKRGKTCKINKKKVRYAAVCNASQFGTSLSKNNKF